MAVTSPTPITNAVKNDPALARLLGLPPGGDEGSGKKPGKKAKAEVLVELALEATDLWHDPEGEPWATIYPDDGHREHWPLRSRAFRRYLGRLFHQHTGGGAPGSKTIQDALDVLEGVALWDGPEHPVFTRVAELGGYLYLDLADERWQAVEIGPDGWRVLPAEAVPIRFRRPRGMLPLPEPTRGESLGLLRPYLNLPDEEAWLLLRGWLVGALHPRGPYPVLAVMGEQGTGKSLLVRFLRYLLDPNTAPLRTSPRDEGDLIIAARNGWVIALDNLSGLPQWLSDAVCRVATGGGLGKRELYTDLDEVLVDVRRPVILNGIDDLTTRDDLRDRSIALTLPTLPEDERREESELWAAFEQDRPAILGALLDAVAAAMRHREETKLDRLPRMADFARWAAAAGRAAGWTPEEFMAAYTGNRQEAAEAGVEASPIGHAILRLVGARGTWEGTATDLLNALRQVVGEDDRTLPKAPETLSNHVRRLAPALRVAGIDVQSYREPGGTTGKRRRMLRLTHMGNKAANPASLPSLPSLNASEQAFCRDGDRDGDSRAASLDRQFTVPRDAAGTKQGRGRDAEADLANPLQNGIRDAGTRRDADLHICSPCDDEAPWD
ncbi:MAG TPA: hypothetical protein GXX55_03520 [Firmicutes bacterium]|nr:hypothetical protein [Bacillota bacterium]